MYSVKFHIQICLNKCAKPTTIPHKLEQLQFQRVELSRVTQGGDGLYRVTQELEEERRNTDVRVEKDRQELEILR